MSSQPARPSEDKQEGGSRFMKRMKTALKKGSISKSSSVSSESTSSSNINNSARAPARAPATATATAPAPSAPMPKRENPPPVPAMISNWSAVQQDRARALFAKYGMTLEPGEWQSPADMTVQRIDRPIRMRVRRTCHRCQTSFSPDKVCVNCQHVRCKKCPRHPTPKSHDQAAPPLTARVPSAKAKEVLANARAKDQPPVQRKRVEPPLTLPSRTGGQDLVLRKPRQRVRRFCHKCNTQFVRKSTECANCQHIRCTKCPRDPPSLSKYPNGYPGDVEPPFERQERVWKKPRRRVRYTCHKCSTLYAAGSKTCANCGQEKCDETIRDPPKKAEKEFDPDVIRRVEERLAKLKTSD